MTSGFISCVLTVMVSGTILSNHAVASPTDSVHVLPDSVVVKATRTGESWLTAPAAVSVVNRDASNRTSGRGLDDYLRGVPGLLIQSRIGSQDVRLTIRGFGARGAGERSNAGTSRGVKVLVDGIPETEPDGRTSFDFIDPSIYGSTEIIRSNSTTLWGNAAGGIINFRSALSSTNLPQASIQTSFGSFGYRRSLAQSEVAFDSMRLLTTILHSTNDGWRVHSNSERTLADVRLEARLDPETRLIANAAYTSNRFNIPGPLTASQYAADPKQAQDDTGNYRPTYVVRDERRFNRLGRLSLMLDHDNENGFGIEANAFITPKLLQRSERNTFRDFNRYYVGGGALSYIPVGMISGSRGRVFVGADYAYQDGAILFYDLLNGGRGTNLAQNKREGAGSGGFFAGFEVNRPIGFSLSGALRYDAVSYFYDDYISPQLDDKKIFDQITPKFSIRYQPTAQITAYAGLGGGFEAPAGNEVDPPGTFGEDTVHALSALLGPIRSQSYEAGVKYEGNNGGVSALDAIRAEAVGYFISTHNELIPYRNGRFYFAAGKTSRVGLELSGNLRWKSGFTQRATLTVSDNSYDDYRIDSLYAGIEANHKGNKIAGVPSMFYSVALGYESHGKTSFFGELEIQGIDAYFVDDANLVSIPAYASVGITAGLKELAVGDFRFTLTGGIRNLTNQKFIASGFVNPDRNRNTNEPIFIEPGLPRNFFIGVSAGIK